MGEQLAAILGDDSGGDSGDASKRMNSFCALKTSHMKGVVNELAEIGSAGNKVIDMNSMMVALDDYVQQAREAKCGVPINFYLSWLDKRRIAKMILDKYEPGWNQVANEADAEEAGSKRQKIGPK